MTDLGRANADALIARRDDGPDSQIVAPQELGPRQPEIADLRRKFDVSRDLTQRARLDAQSDRDFYDGKQLTPTMLKALRMRKQPEVWANRIRPAINGLIGVLEAGKTDPRAWPRNPEDQDSADVASKVLRYVADTSDFDTIKLDVARNFFIEGTGAAVIEYDGQEISITQVRWEEFFYDPFSRRVDFSDATYLGVAKWMDASRVRQMFPEAYAKLGDSLESNGIGVEETWEDRPTDGGRWVDTKRQRLMVVEMYYREGSRWARVVYCATGVLDLGWSPYVDDKGGSDQPIIAISYEVDRENNRYGHVRDMVPLQNEVNARRSRTLHDANTRQIQPLSMDSPPVDKNTARQEAARPDGVIPAGYQVVPKAEMTQGNVLLLQDAKAELERMGPTPAVLGRQDNASQSGRARLVLQQAGMTELAPAMARLEGWERRCYRAMWARARQFKKDPWWIRITDDSRTPKFLQINEPVTALQPQRVIDPQTGGEVIQYAEAVVDVKNRIASLDVDIIVDSVPDTANLAQETWADLLELAKVVPIGTPQFMIAIELSPIPDKQALIERIKAWQTEQAPPPDPMAEQAGQLQMASEAAKIDGQQADTEKTKAETARIAFDMGAAIGGSLPG